MALFGAVWHRSASRRVLPRAFARRLTAGRARLCRPEDRGAAVEGGFGLLTEDFLRDLEDPVELSYTFGAEETSDLIPFAPSLVEASGQLFEFVTAESAAPPSPSIPVPPAADPFTARLSSLEACLAPLAQQSGPPQCSKFLLLRLLFRSLLGKLHRSRLRRWGASRG